MRYDELIAEVSRLASDGASGTLFVRGAEGHTARFVFREGHIVGLAHRATRGLLAIPLLRAMTDSTVTFTPGYEVGVGTGERLPPTSELLAMLASPAVDADQTRAAIETLLAEYIGDAAVRTTRDVVGDARLDTTLAWDAAIERLALELDAGEVHEFVARAKKIVARG